MIHWSITVKFFANVRSFMYSDSLFIGDYTYYQISTSQDILKQEMQIRIRQFKSDAFKGVRHFLKPCKCTRILLCGYV